MIAGRFALNCRRGSGLFLFRRRILDVVVLELVIFIDDRQIVVFIVIFEVVIDIVVVIGTARMVADLDRALAEWPADQPLAGFLLAHPEYRFMARRVQQSARHPYAEIHDNLLAADMLPIDILRCKLAFFGASHFDPRSDRWVRIALFQNQPFPEDLQTETDHVR